MNGELLFNGTKCYFNFDNNVLDIFCLNGEAKFLLWEEIKGEKGITYRSTKKDIPFNRIEGKLFEKNERKIVFYIDTIGYGYNGGLDTEKVVLKIGVLKYLVTSFSLTKKNYLVFESKQFHKFLNLIPNYKLNGKFEDKLAEVTYHSESGNDKAELLYKDKKFSVYPSVLYRGGGSNFEFIPQLRFEFEGSLQETELVELVDIIIVFLQLMFMRTNIYPDSLYLLSDNARTDIYYNKGVNYPEEKENIDSLLSYGFICWNSIYPFFQSLMDDIFAGLIDSKYIGKDSRSRNWIDFEKVSSYAAFFEHVYTIIYGDKVNHKSSSQKEIDIIVSALNAAKDPSKKGLNKRIDYLIGQLDRVSLATKMQKVFKEYKECLSIVKKELYLDQCSNEYIANLCANIRNWTDHGDDKAKLDSHIASCYAFLNCAIYAMLMRRWGMDDKTISYQLNSLYLVQR